MPYEEMIIFIMIVFFVKVKVSKLLIFAVNNKAANLYIIYKCDYICASLYFFLMFSRILNVLSNSSFVCIAVKLKRRRDNFSGTAG